jgi:hypothetical protein
LQAIPQAKIDAFVNGQLQSCIDRLDHLIDTVRHANPTVAQTIVNSPELQFRIADYLNQHGIYYVIALEHYLEGKNVTFHRHYKKLLEGHSLTGNDIQNFINFLPYSQNNIKSVLSRGEKLNAALKQLGYGDSANATPFFTSGHSISGLGMSSGLGLHYHARPPVLNDPDAHELGLPVRDRTYKLL